MVKPLRIGVAGLGSVGAALVRLLQRRRDDMLVRTGRDITVAGVSARSRRDRGLGIEGVVFYDDAAALAASGEIDLFVRAASLW
jgi:homoserine dehydrogenase